MAESMRDNGSGSAGCPCDAVPDAATEAAFAMAADRVEAAALDGNARLSDQVRTVRATTKLVSISQFVVVKPCSGHARDIFKGRR